MYVRSLSLVLTTLVLSLLIGCKTVPGSFEAETEGSWAEFRGSEVEAEAVQAVRFEPTAPTIFEENSDQIAYHDVPVNGKYIALTFDDGPSGRLTPRLLDTLKDHDVRATFFIIGRQAAAFPEIIQRMDGEGHEIANHTWDHPSLDRLSPAKARDQIENTTRIIRALTKRTPRLMRPPYGRTNDALNRWIADDFGMKVILWSVDSNDWRDRDPELVRHNILTATRPGSIILCHDIQFSAVEALPEILAVLQARGYQFVTVSELIEIGKQGL